MRKRGITKSLLIYCLISFVTSFVFSQIPNTNPGEDLYRAVHWGVEEGLSEGVSHEMIKDVNGFLWIGSFHGLSRFDGSGFKRYYAEKNRNNQSIAGNDIHGLIEDSLHNIWIGTGNGLSRYDIKADTFRNFFSTTTILPFWATKEEIFCWDYRQLQFVAYQINSFAERKLAEILPSDNLGHGVSDQNAIFDAASNSIWVEKDDPEKSGGLLQISLITGAKQFYPWTCFWKIPKHSHSFEGMRLDHKRNSIWISSADGLLEFTMADKHYHHFDALNPWQKPKGYSQWAGIDIDNKGRIWQASLPTGIIIFDPESNTVDLPFANDSVQQKNVCDANVFLYCDRTGMTWTGSWAAKGINQLIPFNQVIKHYIDDSKKPNSLSSFFVITCVDAGHNKIWMGTADGINIFDAGTGLFRVIRKKDLYGVHIDGPVLDVLLIDTPSNTALIQSGRLYQMNMTTKQCREIIFRDSADKEMPAFGGGYPTSYKNSLLLSVADDRATHGIYLANRDTTVSRMVIKFQTNDVDISRTATDDDRLIFIKRPDSVTNQTYHLENGKWIRVTHLFDSIPWIKMIYKKPDKSFWLATETALLHYDKELHLIRRYASSDGLPDLPIGGLTYDNLGNIWFNTESQVYQLNLETERITVLSEKDGFEKQGFTQVLDFGRSAAGDLYLPGGILGKGVSRIQPAKYFNYVSSVYLKSLLVDLNPVPLPANIYYLNEISLKYFQNKITIETGVIDFYSKGINHIRYRMGEKENWQYPSNNTIHYEDLTPGDYRLIIQASNSSNEFTGPEKILAIHISPPWWQTWWAISLFVLAFVYLLWMFIAWRSRALKEKNIQLEEKVMHRTKELKHSLEELRETQAQLIQSEKMASLGELTAGIAHEIQNPLNFMNNFSEINKELIEEMQEEIAKGNLDEIKILSGDIKDNEEKINHHGKRADAIVKGMLQHSRTSSGQKEPTDVNALADEYLRLAYHGLRAKDKLFNATLKTDFDSGIGKINLIPQDIGRVLLNLYNNAFYAVNEKAKVSGREYEPTILVGTRQFPPPGGEKGALIEIRVKDNGNGISQKVIDKIFQPFFTTKPTGQGTGLGLSMSYDVIRAHKGELKVESKEGEGAEFIIYLPIKGN